MSYKTNKSHRERIDKKLEKIASLTANYEWNIDKCNKNKRHKYQKLNKDIDQKVGALYEQIKNIDKGFYNQIVPQID